LEKLEKILKNRKGTIGAAMTWVVATIIILLFVFIFVYSSYMISKERQITNFSPILNSEKSYDAGSEQILLALLQTKIENKSLKDLIINGDYDKIENYRNILEKLSNEKDGYWNLYVYEKKGESYESVKSIKTKESALEILGKKNAMVYLSANKQVRLSLN
jgi:hypothetical protein